MEQIIVAFPQKETQQRFMRLLSSEGWESMTCATGAEVMRTVRRTNSTIVICGFFLPDMTADNLAADLRGLANVLVVAKASYLDLCGEENLYKLPSPISKTEFFAALRLIDDKSARFHRSASRRSEDEQRIIRRAKEILMDVNRMNEEEAHRFLRRRAMDCGIKLAEAARQVLASYDV